MSVIDKEMNTTINDNIRARRKRLRWTQAELAQKAGLHKQTLVTIEAGRNTPTWKTIEKIARAFQVDPKDLM